MTEASSGPLAGLRVLEVGHILAGPFAGMLLADLGADVIKIEPIGGDLSRQVGFDYVGEHNVYFASINRNKRSVHIDLATEEGQAELHALAATADALVVNMRPSAIRNLGLDYDSLCRGQPEDRVRRPHRLWPRRASNRLARLRLHHPSGHRRRCDDR